MSGTEGLELSPSVVWTAAGVLLSLQTGATMLRAARDDGIAEPRGRGDPVWMPPCEILNLLALACCVLGVFVVPLLAQSRQATETGFCVYILLYGGVPLATLGHHEAFAARSRGGSYCPAQERNCIIGVCAVVCLYLLLALATTPSDGKAAVAGIAAATVPTCIFFSFFVWRAAEGSGQYAEVAGGAPGARRRPGYGRGGGGGGGGGGGNRSGTAPRGQVPRRASPGRVGGESPRAGSPLSSVLSDVPRGVPERSYASRV
jgi:hypothetical protein